MAPTLLGGSAPATGGAPSGTSSSTRPDSTANGSRRDFDAMLKGDNGSKPAAAKLSANANANDKTRAKPQDAGSGTPSEKPARPGTEAAKDSSDTATPATTADASKPTDTDAPEATDAAPWPPLGLAGLALTGLAPPPADPQLAAALPTTAANDPALNADALLGGAAKTPTAAPTVAPPTNAPAPALATAATDGPIALPVDAQVNEDIALPKALADAIASSNADGDAPAPTFLHALQTATELKANATNAVFSASPTATPHVGGDDFDDALSARIGWLADQKIGHATIKVTPHDLGQIEVRLQMDGDKVHASFTSAHADVRHALESSIPRLREMLNEQGFQLGNADVGHQQTAQDGKAGGGNGERGGIAGDGDSAITETVVSPAQLMRQRGLVDAYA